MPERSLYRDWGIYLDGRWTEPVNGGRLDAVSPSSGASFASVAAGDANDVGLALGAAAKAAAHWASVSAFERAAKLNEAARLIAVNRESLARALAEDQGKPLLGEAYDEVDELGVYFVMAAEDAKRDSGSMPRSLDPNRRILQYRVPLGVVGVISPWNWPYTMGAELFAPALAAGNTVVWVPAPSTTACSALLTDVIAQAGFPPGVFNFVSGPGPVVGDALAGHPALDGIGFVGSVPTGAKVAQRSAGKVQILELGGNGPFVVLEDADLDAAVAATLDAAFLCAGQSCTAGELFLVHRKVREEFTERLLQSIRENVKLGDPFDDSTTMGPLNNEANALKFDRHVQDARQRGARILEGGARAQGFLTNLYAQPTVIDGVSLEMAIATEETFSPVVPIMEIASDEEAIEVMNRNHFGLTTAVFTRDLARGLRYAESVRAGWVNVNASTNLWESHLPFGGRSGTLSGRGRVGGRFVIDTFSEPKIVVLQLGD